MPLQDHMQLISVDDHLIEHPRIWSDRLPAKYRELGPHIVEVPRAKGGPPSQVWEYQCKTYPQIGLNAVAGKKPTSEILHNEVRKPSDMVREALGLVDGDLVIYIERVRYGNGEPIALMHNYIPTALVTLSNEMLMSHGLYELLRAGGIFPYRATQRISAKNASTLEARLLGEPKGTALLTMERTTFDERGRTIEFAQHVYQASRYTLSSEVIA